VHHGRIVKRTGDGSIVEFRSVVDAVRCATEVQDGMIVRNAGLPPEDRIEFRIGIHLGDVVEEGDGDLMGDGVNIAARLEGVAKPGGIILSEQAYWQVKGRLDMAVSDLGLAQLKNIAEPIRVYSLDVGKPAQAQPIKPEKSKQHSMVVLLGAGITAFLMIAAGAWYLFVANRPALVVASAPAPVASNVIAPTEVAHLSIVVLPFTNLSGDTSQDYFVDGIYAPCHMTIVQKPTLGTLTPSVRHGVFPAAAGQCAGKPAPLLNITFAPRSGAHGSDGVVLRSMSDNGSRHTLNIHIDVP
jgi:adenylate cyclase